MGNPEIEDRVKELTAEQLDMDTADVSDDTDISSVTDTLVMIYEQEFDVVIPGGGKDLNTVGDAVQCISELVNNEQPE
ncbi:MAG: hypothetical protein KDC42_09755 [Ignavibacteriae bacterium]|nr:hypothetical protein [Ignavibacteriota bacterium]